MIKLIILGFCFLLSASVSFAALAATPNFKRAVFIVFENANYAKALKQPFFAKIANEGALFTQFKAEAHPSQPNYIAMIAGDTMGVSNDDPSNITGMHLGNLFEQKALSWKAYAEDLPSNCFLGAAQGKYARKHVPFLSFTNVQKNAGECAKVVPASQFQTDLSVGSLATFSMYVPNLDHDGHDTSATAASQWFSDVFGGVLANSAFMQDTLFIITFDESAMLGGNKIYTVFYGANVKPGTKVSNSYNHYSIMRTLEDYFALGTLGRNDLKASPITGIWK